MKVNQMKLSCYNVVLDHKDGHVIYNMISGSLLLLDKEAYYIYLNYNKIDHNNETIKLLKDNKFLIEDDFDEIYYMEKILVSLVMVKVVDIYPN